MEKWEARICCVLGGCGVDPGGLIAVQKTLIPITSNNFTTDQSAAHGGNVDAMIRLGNDYIHGTGTAVDYSQSMQP